MFDVFTSATGTIGTYPTLDNPTLTLPHQPLTGTFSCALYAIAASLAALAIRPLLEGWVGVGGAICTR